MKVMRDSRFDRSISPSLRVPVLPKAHSQLMDDGTCGAALAHEALSLAFFQALYIPLRALASFLRSAVSFPCI